MIKLIHDGENRDGWRSARSVGVGASEVPILFGCGYDGSSELDLYARKVGASVDQIEEHEGMSWGKKLEWPIIEETALRADTTVRRNKALYGNTDYPALVCTPDGFTTGGAPVEVKNICTNIDTEDWDEGIPERFNLQMQSQIAVWGTMQGLFGALLFGGRLVWGWIPRDDALIAEIDRRTRAFWNRVTTGNPPASNGSQLSRKAAIALANSSQPKELFEGEISSILLDWESAKADEARVKELAKVYEAKRRAAEDSLILAMGGSRTACTSSGWEFERTVTKRRSYTVEAKEIEGLKIRPPKENAA